MLPAKALSPPPMERLLNSRESRPELRNPLMYEYEMKRMAYKPGVESPKNMSLDNNRLQQPNHYNFNTDSAIFKKQAHDFNIISFFPESQSNLREYHKLSA